MRMLPESLWLPPQHQGERIAMMRHAHRHHRRLHRCKLHGCRCQVLDRWATLAWMWTKKTWQCSTS